MVLEHPGNDHETRQRNSARREMLMLACGRTVPKSTSWPIRPAVASGATKVASGDTHRNRHGASRVRPRARVNGSDAQTLALSSAALVESVYNSFEL